jgi:hypothetical protein
MQVALEKTKQSNRLRHDRAVAETAQGVSIPSKQADLQGEDQ